MFCQSRQHVSNFPSSGISAFRPFRKNGSSTHGYMLLEIHLLAFWSTYSLTLKKKKLECVHYNETSIKGHHNNIAGNLCYGVHNQATAQHFVT